MPRPPHLTYIRTLLRPYAKPPIRIVSQSMSQIPPPQGPPPNPPPPQQPQVIQVKSGCGQVAAWGLAILLVLIVGFFVVCGMAMSDDAAKGLQPSRESIAPTKGDA